MAFLDKVKENVNLKEGVAKITAKVSDLAQSGKEKGQELLHRNKTGWAPAAIWQKDTSTSMAM